jgi:hypothetical protein
MTKLLIVLRLHNPNWSFQGQPKTLTVSLREDKTLTYTFYGGWQNSGTSFAISNLQMQKSLPMGSRNFKTTKDLLTEIKSCLSTGCGSNKIASFEILNDLEDTP